MSEAAKIGSFSRLVAIHEAGALDQDLTEKLTKAIAEVESHFAEFRGAPKASLSVKFTFLKEDEVLKVYAEVKESLPARPRAKRVYYATPDNNLTQTNPRQHEMFGAPREVASAPTEVRQV